MSRDSISLPPGRRQDSLSDLEMRRAESIFRALGYNYQIEFEPQSGGKTRFVVRPDEATGEEHGIIIIGPDIFPGVAVANPNSILDATAAAAHEITHFIRWEEGRELPVGNLDEAMTSLQAVCIFKTALNSMQIEQLVSDALERLIQFTNEIASKKSADPEKREEVKNAD